MTKKDASYTLTTHHCQRFGGEMKHEIYLV